MFVSWHKAEGKTSLKGKSGCWDQGLCGACPNQPAIVQFTALPTFLISLSPESLLEPSGLSMLFRVKGPITFMLFRVKGPITSLARTLCSLKTCCSFFFSERSISLFLVSWSIWPFRCVWRGGWGRGHPEAQLHWPAPATPLMLSGLLVTPPGAATLWCLRVSAAWNPRGSLALGWTLQAPWLMESCVQGGLGADGHVGSQDGSPGAWQRSGQNLNVGK